MATLGDWAGVATVAAAILGTVLASYWNRKRGVRAEQPFVTFNDDDRKLLKQLRDALGGVAIDGQDRRILFEIRDVGGSLRDAILSLGRRIEQNTDAQAEHRRAVEDNTRALRDRANA